FGSRERGFERGMRSAADDLVCRQFHLGFAQGVIVEITTFRDTGSRWSLRFRGRECLRGRFRLFDRRNAYMNLGRHTNEFEPAFADDDHIARLERLSKHRRPIYENMIDGAFQLAVLDRTVYDPENIAVRRDERMLARNAPAIQNDTLFLRTSHGRCRAGNK